MAINTYIKKERSQKKKKTSLTLHIKELETEEYLHNKYCFVEKFRKV